MSGSGQAKLQIPNSKLQINPKPQIPKTESAVRAAVWSLSIGASLGFGRWSLEVGASSVFGVWCLEFGVWSLHPGVWSFHSYLSASIGSTRAARRAGSQHAREATAIRSIEIAVNVAGSVGSMPK